MPKASDPLASASCSPRCRIEFASGAVLLRAVLIGLAALVAGYLTNAAMTDVAAPPFLIALATSVVVVVAYSVGLVTLRAPERAIVREIAAALRRRRA